jgi:nitrite reductase/ring-hydroxylating ferredoxin subunit
MKRALCPLQAVPEEGARRCVVPQLEALVVVRHAGQVYVLSDTCSHGLASLSEGEVENGRIYCPYHAGAFDLATGAAVEKPCTLPIKSYPVAVVDGQICIDHAE